MTPLRFTFSVPHHRSIPTEKFSPNAAAPQTERVSNNLNCSCVTEEAYMPAIIIPVLWVGGAAILLGGGWYVIGHMVH